MGECRASCWLNMSVQSRWLAVCFGPLSWDFVYREPALVSEVAVVRSSRGVARVSVGTIDHWFFTGGYATDLSVHIGPWLV